MKTKYLLNVAFLGFLFVAGSCKKSNQTYTTKVEGVIRNKLTGAVVQGIPVKIYGCSFVGSSTKCNESIQTTSTDQNGYYNITVVAEKRQGYEIAILVNDKLASTPNPASLVTGKSNTVNFSQFPIKKLKAHVIVQRHNRSVLGITVGNWDYFDFFSYSLYQGPNPTTDFDSTFVFNIEAGRQYKIFVALYDRTANTIINEEDFSKLFTVNNTDTTFVDFVVQ